jgi:hypothetical protein
VNDDGKVDPAVDQLLGSCVYPSNIAQQTIAFSSPIVIPAGGGLSLVVSYTAPPSATPGSTFELNLGYVDAEGLTSGVRVPIISDEIRSARLIVGAPPISIAAAKRLPIDQSTGTTDVVLLKGVVVTADLQPSMSLVYGEDQLRTAGIGVLLGPDDHNDGEVIPEGARVDLLGRVRLLDGAELVLEIIEGAMLNVDEPLAPIAMNNKSAGGGVFGSQPAVLDNAPAMIPAAGLNNVGMLVRTWGYVRGMGQLTIDGKLSDVVWIDDGSGLQDGATDLSGIAVMKPADWQGDAPTGLLVVTGIIRAVPNGDGKAVRLLVPRSQSDTTSFPAST